ncbi:MAG: threonine synthase [Bacteroidota bacterium]
MEFYSTNDTTLRVNLKEAVLNSLPKDRGLYMPESILPLSEEFWHKFKEMSFPEIGYEVSRQLLKGSVEDTELRQMTAKALSFDAPVRSLGDGMHVLELFHGPTLAFKDFGARFMAQIMSYLNREEDKPLTILVATSGDTGGAVAAGFYKTPNIQVFILYPKGRVSPLQEKQLTTLGENITAFEVDGSFDDCQAMVKQAFLDEELSTTFQLTSANSINITRLVPQSFYYFRAMQQLAMEGKKIVMCIPSGNFGNLTAGLLAKNLGLPIHHFIAATNINDIVPSYLHSGKYEPRASAATISNAMDVGNPSNFARMKDLFGSSWEEMKGWISGYAFDDKETMGAIKEVYEKYNYTIDPHGAVGYLAAKTYQQDHPDEEVVILGTAHPSKFPGPVEEATGAAVEIPERLARLAELPKEAHAIGTAFEAFKSMLMKMAK